MAQAHEIRVENARSHNLKGVTCRIPLRSLTVVSGVSGSGKSTLAFDTLYAEGQRRYVTSLSTYARQFLERLPRPQVDSISHLPPAIAIEQRNRVTQARSTVGTTTEVLDHLRLLFAKSGTTLCPDCARPVHPGGVESVVERVLERYRDRRITLASPIAGGENLRESGEELRDRLARDGFTRWIDPEGRALEATELSGDEVDGLRRHGALILDRIVPRSDDDRVRIAESAAQAFGRGERRLWVIAADPEDGADEERAVFREGLVCDGCDRDFVAPDPALFSFDSPLGACPACQGFGRIPGLDEERVVPDATLSIRGDAIVPFKTQMGKRMKRDLMQACRAHEIDVESAWGELDEGQRRLVIDGDDGDWYGVRGFFEWLEGRRYKVQARVLIARYRRYDPCVDCGGARLRPEALHVKVAGRDIAELSRLTLEELSAWIHGLDLDAAAAARGERVVALLRDRLATLQRVGLGYLALDRQMRSLSGGEAQRIQLGTALGGRLTSTLYVLDEPSIGLHPRDVDRLLEVLRDIRGQGNTLVLVEHAPEIIEAADHLIDLGPGAGRHGGAIVAQGSVEEVRAHPSSLTGRALRGELGSGERKRRAARGALRIRGASEHNLQDLDVDVPLGCLVVFTGVSGAGKSTLVRSVLVGQLRGDAERGACDAIEGAEGIEEIVVVDQSAASRSPRSNPATVSKAFEGIRKLFAGTREARALGVGPGWFSFNVAGGRCDECEGAGEVVIDMQFLDDLRVPCDQCGGLRYRREVLDVRVEGRNIVEVLDLTLEEAAQAFAGERTIAARLEPFVRVGLGYLQLGQPLSTLSGGEHQRLRLGLALADSGRSRLYVLDEPTTGLHPADVDRLLACLDELVDQGGSVLVVEHNLDVIRRADHVIDLGPEGGPGGGALVAEGPPEEIARVEDSHTGRSLRRILRASGGAQSGGTADR